MQPDMYFTGERIEKTGDEDYTLTNGIFTSCDLDQPGMVVPCRQADVTLDDYAHMRNVSFRARSCRSSWRRGCIWPTKPDRSQGLAHPPPRSRMTFGDAAGARLLLSLRRLRRRHGRTRT